MNTRTSRLKHSFNVAFDAVSVCVTISVLNTNLRKCQAEFRRRLNRCMNRSASCLPCDRLKCELEFLGLREAGLGLLCSDLFEKRVVFSSTESGDERIDR